MFKDPSKGGLTAGPYIWVVMDLSKREVTGAPRYWCLWILVRELIRVPIDMDAHGS